MLKIIDIPTENNKKEELYDLYINNNYEIYKMKIKKELVQVVENKTFRMLMANTDFLEKSKIFFEINKNLTEYNDVFKEVKNKIIDMVTLWIFNYPQYFISSVNKNIYSKISVISILMQDLLLNKNIVINAEKKKNFQLVVEEKDNQYMPISVINMNNLKTGRDFLNYILYRDNINKKNTNKNIADVNILSQEIYTKFKKQNISFNGVEIMSLISSLIYSCNYSYKDDFLNLINKREEKNKKNKIKYINIIYQHIKKINIFNIYKNISKKEKLYAEEIIEFSNNYVYENKEGKKTLTLILFEKEIKNIFKIYPTIYLMKKTNDININHEDLFEENYIEYFSMLIIKYLSSKYYMNNFVFSANELKYFIYIFFNIINKGYLKNTKNISDLNDNIYFETFIKTKNINMLYDIEDIYKKCIKNKMINQETKIFVKSLNPTKFFAWNTKQIFKQILLTINLMEKHFTLKYFSNILEIFKTLNVSEKRYRMIINHLFNSNNVFKTKKIGDISIKELNNSYLHNLEHIYLISFNNLINSLNKNKNKNISKKSLIKFIDLAVSMNLKDGNKENKLETLIKYLIDLLPLLKEEDINKIKNINNVYKLYWDARKEEMNKKLKYLNSKIKLDNNILEISKKMNKLDEYLKLLEYIVKNKYILNKYKENNYINTINLKKETIFFKVGIYAHNEQLSILGTGISNVCISIDSKYKIEQLKKEYLNIIVTDKEGVPIVWGLLVKAINKIENKTYYILNNLQGGINNSSIDIEEVKKYIIEILLKLKNDNDIKGIIMPKLFFNNINITEDLNIFEIEKEKGKGKIELLNNARLDFYFDKTSLEVDFKHDAYNNRISFYIL